MIIVTENMKMKNMMNLSNNLEDKIDIPDWVTKRMLLRVLEGEEF